MMFKPGFLIFFALLTLFACGPETPFPAEEMETQQAAWDKMIDGHDIVMPLMGDLRQADRKLKALLEGAEEVEGDFAERARQARADLETAEDGMMAWMVDIRDNPLKAVRERYDDHAAVMASIDKETVEIERVAEEMQASLAAAKTLIRERSGN